MMKKLFTLLCIAGLSAGCASVPPAPYWENPQWVNAMAQTIHSHVRYPAGLSQDPKSAGAVEIQFAYADGRVRDPILTKSTGDQALDNSIVTQMSDLTLPAAQGADTQAPHRFQMTLFLAPPDLVAFIDALHTDLQRHGHYPEIAVRTGQQGIVFAEFNYRDGAILDPQIYKSSGSHMLDESVIEELRTMPAPPAPPRIQGHTLHFTVPVGFCFSARPCVKVVYAAQTENPTH